MRFSICLVAAVACGGSMRPRDVRASARSSGVEVWWSSSSVVAAHRVQLADLDSSTSASEAVFVQGTRASLRGSASGVWVDALPGGRAIGIVSAGDEGGTGAAWQIFAPWDFRRGELSASFTRLAATERLGVLLVNFGGSDAAQAEVVVDGAADTPVQAAELTVAAAAAPPALHEIVRARESALALEQPAPVEALEPGARRSFCVVQGLDFSHHVRKAATLAIATAHAEMYVDDDDLGEYEVPRCSRSRRRSRRPSGRQ